MSYEPDPIDYDRVCNLPPFDEAALRRSSWDNHKVVVLADGKEWALPRLGPVEVLMIPGLDGMVGEMPEPTHDWQIKPAEEFAAFQDALWRFARRIGAKLLEINYDLSRDHAWSLVADDFPSHIARQDFHNAVLEIISDAVVAGLVTRTPFLAHGGNTTTTN